MKETLSVGGSVELCNDDNDTLSFHGVSGVTRQTVSNITDNSGGGTSDGTISSIVSRNTSNGHTVADLATTRDAIKELSTKLNAVIDALQVLGLFKQS